MTDTSPCSHLQFFGEREFCPDCGLSRTEALVEACAPFLKDDETPAECIVRNRRDVDGCLTMLIDERRKVESLRSRLAEAERDSQRLDWLERHLFEGKWDGTIGRPKSWYMAGPYRHTLQRMRGDALREAIDLAMQADSASGEGEK